MKTNAARILEAAKVPFELREYEVDESDLSAETVARKVGLPPERVFKTLACRGDKHGVCYAVVPGDAELDLKALARATGDKSIDMVSLKEVQRSPVMFAAASRRSEARRIFQSSATRRSRSSTS